MISRSEKGGFEFPLTISWIKRLAGRKQGLTRSFGLPSLIPHRAGWGEGLTGTKKSLAISVGKSPLTPTRSPPAKPAGERGD